MPDSLAAGEELSDRGESGFAQLRCAIEKNAEFSCLTQACHDLNLMPIMRSLVDENPGVINSTARQLFGELTRLFFVKTRAKLLIRSFLPTYCREENSEEATFKVENSVKHAFSYTLELYVRNVIHHLIASEEARIGSSSLRQFNLLVWGALNEVVDKCVPMLVAESLGVPAFKRYRKTLPPPRKRIISPKPPKGLDGVVHALAA